MDEFLQYLLAFAVVMLGVVFVLRSWLNSNRGGGGYRRFSRSSRRRHRRRDRYRSSRRGMRNDRPLWRPYDDRSGGAQDTGTDPNENPKQ